MRKNKAVTGSITHAGGHKYARGSVALFLLLSLLLLALQRAENPVAMRVSSQITDMAVPVLSVLARPFEAVQDAAVWAGEMASLRKENIRLKNENIQLLKWSAVARDLEMENQALRSVLNTAPAQPQQYITAKVVSDIGGPYMRAALINAGTVAGIKNGQPVVAAEGLLGRVVEAGDTTARVLLLSDINSRVPVMLETSRAKSILSGTGTDSPTLSYLGSTSKVEAGERVVTSGDGGIFPAGVPVGKVMAQEGGIWQVQLFASPEKTSFVRTIDYKF